MPTNEQFTSRRFFCVLAVGMIILGCRWWLVGAYGNLIPYWDQWAEAGSVIKPMLAGTFSLANLLIPHNHQPVFYAKGLACFSFWCNGQWDPQLQSIFHQLVPALTAMLVLGILFRHLPFRADGVLIGGVILLWTLPFGQQATLNSFVSGFHFMIFFAVLCWWGLLLHEPLTLKWWFGLCAGLAGALAMGSGFFALLAALLIETGTVILNGRGKIRQRWWRLILPILVLAGFYLLYYYLPGRHVPQTLRPSLKMFLNGIGKTLAWPLVGRPWLAFLFYAPLALTFIKSLVLREVPSRSTRFLLAIGTWAVMQTVAMAIARQPWLDGPSSRYMDILALAALANFCLLLQFSFPSYPRQTVGSAGTLPRYFTLIWLLVFMLGLAQLVITTSAPNAIRYGHNTATALIHARDYLRSGDLANLRIPPSEAQAAPLVHATTLAKYLDDPQLQRAFPTAMQLPDLTYFSDAKTSATGFVRDGIPAGIRPYLGETILGSFVGKNEQEGKATKGEFTTPLLTIKEPLIQIPWAGELNRKGLSLKMQMENGKTLDLSPRRAAKLRWFYLYVKNPGQPFRLIGKDESARKWFAIAQPRGAGRFARFKRTIFRMSPGLVAFGFAALLLLFSSELFSLVRGKEEQVR